jgi:hypothetical protein
VSGVPESVVVDIPSDHVVPGDAVRVSADVSDARFLRVNDATVRAVVTAPDGSISETPLDWTVGRDGEYRGVFTAAAPGMYAVQVVATHAGREQRGRPVYVNAEDSRDEYFGSQMRAPLMRRIADETGGRFYTSASVATLPEDIAYTGRGTTVQEHKDLWDMPIIFLLAVLLLGAEWGYRRWRGLA